MSIGYRLRGATRTERSGEGKLGTGSKIERGKDRRRASFALGVIGIISIDPGLTTPLLPPRPSPTISLELGG